ncbi:MULTISPECIES: HEAT repeat domain-containing protein [unclassified Methanoregula]|uniref:HEAT repeat domain-containing protein n=1 Tax=unclassified Methanoregula TaxID=2649730 RepID=UPI0009CF708A|nr:MULTISPECIES: HEAT repeat domain-containing protein [unclassified Methanoregula]OPX64865.1 MAG: hypothetical protein A4E33_00603 [Methanoregula sp. PtaB.Bin085]OPY32917.1 MAG: hypothetical protein A4E34_02294 [Methanoregula sp. PtaU1.Bin006]
MSTTFFCPFCGISGQEAGEVCTRCGKSLDSWKEHPFEERLLLTLRHPITEQRMLAIRILGQRRYERAVPFFAEMIAAGQDVYTLREIVSALARINSPESRALADRLGKHPSPVVREACDRAGVGSGEGGAR